LLNVATIRSAISLFEKTSFAMTVGLDATSRHLIRPASLGSGASTPSISAAVVPGAKFWAMTVNVDATSALANTLRFSVFAWRAYWWPIPGEDPWSSAGETALMLVKAFGGVELR